LSRVSPQPPFSFLRSVAPLFIDRDPQQNQNIDIFCTRCREPGDDGNVVKDAMQFFSQTDLSNGICLPKFFKNSLPRDVEIFEQVHKDVWNYFWGEAPPVHEYFQVQVLRKPYNVFDPPDVDTQYGSVIVVPVSFIRPASLQISVGCHLRCQSDNACGCTYLGQVLEAQPGSIKVNGEGIFCVYVRISCSSAEVASQLRHNDRLFPAFSQVEKNAKERDFLESRIREIGDSECPEKALFTKLLSKLEKKQKLGEKEEESLKDIQVEIEIDNFLVTKISQLGDSDEKATLSNLHSKFVGKQELNEDQKSLLVEIRSEIRKNIDLASKPKRLPRPNSLPPILSPASDGGQYDVIIEILNALKLQEKIPNFK
jgi:hypothetical protein